MTKEEVRVLRDKCYGVSISDAEWDSCGNNWMKPESIEFLKAHQFEL